MAKTNRKQLDLFSQTVAEGDTEHWFRPRIVIARPDAYHWYYRRHIPRKPLHQTMGSLNKRHK